MQVGRIEYAPNYGRLASWTPWGNLPIPPVAAANDNYPIARANPVMIGLTGKRNVGKSTVALLLEEEYGFQRIHAFESGKEASVTYFAEVTGDIDVAIRMVHGDLKDVPSPYLPGGVAPRFFLEKFGHFMGAQMGVEWTLGMEIARARRNNPRAPIVVESLVYEAPWFKAQGGIVWRLERPGHEGPAGIESDSVQATIEADVTIAAHDLDQLRRMVRQEMRGD